MAADSNMGYINDRIMASALNSRSISFQSGLMSSESGMIPFGNNNNNSIGMNNTAGIIFSGNSNTVIDSRGRGRGSPGNSSGGHVYDTGQVTRQDHPGFAVEWSVDEQAKLEEGLAMYINEPNMMRYVKIAASLSNKTVRDVALRCRWMTNESGKRRKQEHHPGKKMKDKKETLLESSLKPNLSTIQPLNMASYSLMMHHLDPNNPISSEAPAISDTSRHLLEENAKVFNQITSNFATFKVNTSEVNLFSSSVLTFVAAEKPPWRLEHQLRDFLMQIQDNIDLFCRTRKNITDILKEMREVPGIMSQMPPLPVSINEELADTFLHSTYQRVFGLPREAHLKQEPRS
ncbi:hypothetical protein IFM89_007760 [Coptis chinensis]|uniref:Uncharacterized protein n=1 Tax=Coptis chinensis TaxID=261450 RepID=A0A835IXJ3_9MAGN|nr:hypothetical protein IFM89_007760 [Coptis chinensis]